PFFYNASFVVVLDQPAATLRQLEYTSTCSGMGDKGVITPRLVPEPTALVSLAGGLGLVLLASRGLRRGRPRAGSDPEPGPHRGRLRGPWPDASPRRRSIGPGAFVGPRPGKARRRGNRPGGPRDPVDPAAPLGDHGAVAAVILRVT